MNTTVKNVLKYSVMLVLTGLLLKLSFDNIEVTGDQSKVDYLVTVWNSANKPFLFLSGAVALLSHLLRALRWKLLLNPIGHQVNLIQGFLSVMIGYFINLAIPRGGEVSRCYNLYRLNKTPIEVSLGTVVAERVIDLLFLITLISISFFIELDTLLLFFESEEVTALRNSSSKNGSRPYGLYLLLFGGFILIGLAVLAYFFKRNKRIALKLFLKLRSIFFGIRNGVKSILKLEQRMKFILYSLFIWICYYLMMFFVMLAFPETENLGFGAALTIFVIGGIAMAMPLPGGAGSFHVLVSTGLVLLYGLVQDKAIAFTFIFHGWQTLIIIIVGAISLIWSQILRNKIAHTEQNSK